VECLERAGYETWAVGGAVRDELRGGVSADWDFATRARPGQLRKVFHRTVPVGVEHGTVGVLARDGVMYEVTTFRRDVETDGRHARVAFADSLDEDLARRDFTINALAWHPLRHVLHDPYGGRRDLEARVLRTVGDPAERFAEDWLRILRALRFAGRFRMEVHPDTWEALTSGVGELVRLSPERVREELMKVLGGPGRPSDALTLYRRSGALAVVLPEVAALDEGGWGRTLAEVDLVSEHRPWLRVAGLFGRIGEPPARPGEPDPAEVSGLRAAHPAAARGAVRAAAVLTRLRASNAQIARVSELVAAGLTPPDPDDPAVLRHWLARVGPHHLRDLARLWIARRRADPSSFGDPLHAIGALRSLLRGGPALSVSDLAIDGRDLIRLGLRPGPHFGRILDRLLGLVLDDPSRNRSEILEGHALRIARETEDGVGAGAEDDG
jgi:tRNA nucleotidyltransferase (CCA-adding enzyme)